MMPARWARGATTGALTLAITAALGGCADLNYGTPAAPLGQPAPAAAVNPAEPCPYLRQADVARLAGDQRTQLIGSVNACSFSIGGQYNYQINVFPNDNDRYRSERDRLFRSSTSLQGIGDEAFYRDGTGITTIGARKGDTFFTVNLVPAVADPNGGAATAPVVAPADPDDQLLSDADVNGDRRIDADLDGDTVIDDDADPAAVAAADADEDGTVDDAVLAALDDADAAAGAQDAPVTDITAAKARMPDIAAAVANSI